MSRTLEAWTEAGGMSTVYASMGSAFRQITLDIPRSGCFFEGEKQALERVRCSLARC